MQPTLTTCPDYEGAENFILEKLTKELSPGLTYHGVHHTIDVMNAALQIAAYENLTPDDIFTIKVACAFHDSGYLFTYYGHEKTSCELARLYLPQFFFNEVQIDSICAMIRSTHLPQKPITLWDKIICDADLDYLGRKDAEPIAYTLYEELKNRHEINNPLQWDMAQIKFLSSHHYFTEYSKKNRELQKQKYLSYLLEVVKTNDL